MTSHIRFRVNPSDPLVSASFSENGSRVSVRILLDSHHGKSFAVIIQHRIIGHMQCSLSVATPNGCPFCMRHFATAADTTHAVPLA